MTTAPGARGSISISLLALCLLTVSLAGPAECRDDIQDMVRQAARPEIMFGQPEVFDSLLEQMVAGDRGTMTELIDMADTPWAWQFEVIRQACALRRNTAREVLLEHLGDNSLPDVIKARWLVLLEKLGRVGDESVLEVYLRAESGALVVPALRCLAAFGAPEESMVKLIDLCGSSDPQIRLGAAWAAGELVRRDSKPELPDSLEKSLTGLLSDPVPQVRITASETLRFAGIESGAGMLRR